MKAYFGGPLHCYMSFLLYKNWCYVNRHPVIPYADWLEQSNIVHNMMNQHFS